MQRVFRYLRPGILALAVAAGLLLAVPVAARVRLFLGLLLVAALSLKILVRWSEGYPHRRRAFFIGVLFAPVVVLILEVLFAFHDARVARLAKPLRVTTEFDPHGLLVRNEACSFQIRPSCEHGFWGGVRIDSNGFRSSYDVALQKDPVRIRVMLTGGSSAFGWGLPDGQDVAGHLRTVLNGHQANGPYEVINAAVPFYTSFHELNLYLHVLHDYDPDVLIVLHGRNDAYFAFGMGSQWRPVSAGWTGVSPFLPATPPPEPERVISLEAMLMRSALYRRYDGLFPRPEGPPRRSATYRGANPYERPASPAGQTNPAFIGQFARHRDVLGREAARNGCRCILALQPVIHVGKLLTPTEERNRHLWGDYGQHFREFWPEVQTAATRLDVPGAIAVDLSDLFTGFSGEAYLDECHYTSEGNRLIAQRLAEIIQTDGPPFKQAQTRPGP